MIFLYFFKFNSCLFSLKHKKLFNFTINLNVYLWPSSGEYVKLVASLVYLNIPFFLAFATGGAVSIASGFVPCGSVHCARPLLAQCQMSHHG